MLYDGDCTVCIPYANYHKDIVQRAIESVNNQTVSVHVITYFDEHARGSGYARNELAKRVKTEFITFLDADDELMPTFIEETLKAYKGDRYVYTDFYNDEGESKPAPECAWINGTWHIVTALLPMSYFKAIGGFNESLPALEDTDFWMKLTTSGMCGRRLPYPLVHYSKNGVRSHNARADGTEESLKKHFAAIYGGRKMACCGDKAVMAVDNAGKRPGDTLAITLWGGNHTEFGRASGRVYPRSGNGKSMWVDPRDLAASPHLWRKVLDQPEPELAMVAPPPAPDVAITPNVSKLTNRSLSILKKHPDPVFAFSSRNPNSYVDIKRLVELSGYESTTVDKIDVFSEKPVVVVSPDPIPDFNNVPARVICWQLEYAGDYASNYSTHHGELWASDPTWAAGNKARFVVLGSHPGLGVAPGDVQHDVTMLGYLIPRRRRIMQMLDDLRWADSPGKDIGYGNQDRSQILSATYLMLHIHQFDNSPYFAPQRLAVAAAFKMPVVSEAVPDGGPFAGLFTFAPYSHIPGVVHDIVNSRRFKGDGLYEFLCVRNTFRKCVDEALNT